MTIIDEAGIVVKGGKTEEQTQPQVMSQTIRSFCVPANPVPALDNGWILANGTVVKLLLLSVSHFALVGYGVLPQLETLHVTRSDANTKSGLAY